jgi:hypothetical protein
MERGARTSATADLFHSDTSPATPHPTLSPWRGEGFSPMAFRILLRMLIFVEVRRAKIRLGQSRVSRISG